MITQVKKTKTGYKITLASVIEGNKICHSVILCSHTKSEGDAINKAQEHIKTHLISFKRFPNLQEYKTFEIIF
jgi:hypothetical protein